MNKHPKLLALGMECRFYYLFITDIEYTTRNTNDQIGVIVDFMTFFGILIEF